MYFNWRLNCSLLSLSDWFTNFTASFKSFYDVNPVLTIFVCVMSTVGLILVLLCMCVGFVSMCKKLLKKRQDYNLRNAEAGYDKKYEDHGWTYESIPMNDFVEYDQEPVRREFSARRNMERFGGIPVMLTDERGNSLPYTLRTRAKDGSIEKVTTQFRETTL
jgi:hypothetical protein